jgi:hypothetical protein
MPKKSPSRKRGRGNTNQAPNLERTVSHEPMAASKVPTLDSRVDCTVVSFRVRLCDTDGVSAKAAIDGCVHRGLLGDDSTKYIRKIEFEQVKVKNKEDEKTLLIFIPTGTVT